MNKQSHIAVVLLLAAMASGTAKPPAVDAPRPVKVFILAGDENCLEQGVVEGRTDGTEVEFFPGATPAKDEKVKHATCAVYKGAYKPGTDYDTLTPEVADVAEIGDQRTRRRGNGQRGSDPIPLTPFPELAQQDGHTTVLRGYLSVRWPGRYELQPGTGEAAFNVTSLEGEEVYRRDVGQATPAITPVQLEPKKRYAFRTIFFGKPGHDFRVPLLNKPGTLTTAVSEDKRFAFLKDSNGEWVKRDDGVLYDLHPIHNNTKALGHFLQAGGVADGGQKVSNAIGPELMLGHVLGDHFEEPVLILRFATRDPIWFFRGSRSLAHDYRPPSSGGGSDLDGSWDVIHFNWGVWDTGRPPGKSEGDAQQDKTQRSVRVPIDAYERNLRELVGKMKKTGATLIWATTTPLHQDCPASIKGDEVRYNAVAEKIMKENGVIIDDLYAESIRQGYPKAPDVHSVGHLAPKVTKTIEEALAARKKNTTPLPRVLLIGDSITGSYEKEVVKNLDGKAFVCKNPGNGEHSGTGVAKIDEWLDLKRYLLNGQEYLELVDGVRSALANLDRVYPGYAGQEAELAGLVWFQGIKDAASGPKSADYGNHLPNLIRDLRKDLKVPELPVVVAAIGFGGTNMNSQVKSVFDAQMAVGDPKQYPEFAGNVTSIDTRKFQRSPDLSPGGRDVCYHENAVTFLEIGEAMGRAMLKLQGKKESETH